MRIVARWESSGWDYLELMEEGGTYTFTGKDCGGTLPPMPDDEAAIAYMERPAVGDVAILKKHKRSTKRVPIDPRPGGEACTS